MNEIKSLTAPGIPLLLDEIDTDRIIPARYLRCVTFEGIGEHVFEDDRRQNPKHPFDDPRFKHGGILVAGRNFGCGSSREHAPQALLRWGIQAVVAESFAEIFFGNCTSLGIPAVTTSRANLTKLVDAIQADPATEITVDLDKLEIRCMGQAMPCNMPASARSTLVSGQWDSLSQLLEAEPEIRESAAGIPYLNHFAV